MNNYKIFSGNAHPALAASVANLLGKELGHSTSSQFSDGETRVMIEESARGEDIYIIQPTCSKVNDTLMELCIMVDAFKRASVQSITAVMPYFGYARQDKKVKPREPITAKMVADFLQIAGVTRVMTVDIHSEQVQGFFNIPMDNLYAGPIFVDHFRARGFGGDDFCVVSPDVGGTSRAENLSKHLECETAIIKKSRPAPNQVVMGKIIGDVKGKRCLFIDDMMDTCGTLVKAAERVMDEGAISADVCCTHAVLSGSGADRLRECDAIHSVTCLDTIPVDATRVGSKLTVLSVAPLIASAIERHQKNESVSELFAYWKS